MVLRAVQVRMRVLVIEVVRVLGMQVLVVVVVGVARRLVMTLAMRVLMTRVLQIVGMTVLVVSVFGRRFGHRSSSGVVSASLRQSQTSLRAYVNIHVCA